MKFMAHDKKYLVVIVGPTAVGKTEAAIKIASYFEQSEIVAADSRQFYREMEIGTAKPSIAQQEALPHHFINNINVSDYYSAGKFEKEAIEQIERIHMQGGMPFLVGGSGLYIDAVCTGFDDVPALGENAVEIRKMLTDKFANSGIIGLQEKLKEKDPSYYKKTDVQNPTRLLRALEVCYATGKPYSSFLSGVAKVRSFEIIKIGLNLEREELYGRINNRVDAMIHAGLEYEVKSLTGHKDTVAFQAVGYKEFLPYFTGQATLQEVIEAIKQNTRRFAKRQLTWFRKHQDINWFTPDDISGINDCIMSRW